MKAVTMGKKIWSVAAVVLVASMASTVIAEEATLAEALKGGEVKIQFRYRYEDVDQDNALENANASTLKSRLNYTSAVFSGLQAQVEVDNVSQIGDDDYNSTSNNETG